jgi:uncharacterized protein YfbU (UPF0304 family)
MKYDLDYMLRRLNESDYMEIETMVQALYTQDQDEIQRQFENWSTNCETALVEHYISGQSIFDDTEKRSGAK